MSASYEFTIWYPELKATALIRRLKTEGTTVENELEKALESLFEQYIPEPDRTSILAALLEADARQAEEDAQRKAEALRITAVQIILDGKFVCWKLNRDTSTEISLLSISRYLRTSLKQKDCSAAEAFLKCLGPCEEVNSKFFHNLLLEKLRACQQVCTVCVLDFDNKTAEVALPQNKRLQCHFRDLTGAAYYADRKKGLADWQSKERFRAALSGRGVTQSHWPKIEKMA